MLDTPTLISTAFLTVLLCIGLFFFIRASAKDRTEVIRLVATDSETSLLEQLQAYLTQRAYRVIAVDAAHQRMTFEGFVRPSVFLALFLTFLAAIATLCLSLVLAMLFPAWATLFPLLMIVVAPLAGLFYWKKSGRSEQVLLQVETVNQDPVKPESFLVITAHRDELAELQRTLPLKSVAAE